MTNYALLRSGIISPLELPSREATDVDVELVEPAAAVLLSIPNSFRLSLRANRRPRKSTSLGLPKSVGEVGMAAFRAVRPFGVSHEGILFITHLAEPR